MASGWSMRRRRIPASCATGCGGRSTWSRNTDPDIVYMDDYRLPFGQTGLDAVAHYYNHSLARSGDLDVVLTAKQLSHYQRHGIVEDVERGFLGEIRPQPWQTSTCIGSWHYDRPLFERHGYKPARRTSSSACAISSRRTAICCSACPSAATARSTRTRSRSSRRWRAGSRSMARRSTGRGRGGSMARARPGRGPASRTRATRRPSPPRISASRRRRERSTRCSSNGRRAKRRSLRSARNAMPEARIERVELLGGGPLEFRRDADALRFRLPRPDGDAFVPAVRISGSGLV